MSQSLFPDALGRLLLHVPTHIDLAPWVLVSHTRLQCSFMLYDTLTGLDKRINENPLASCAASLCGCRVLLAMVPAESACWAASSQRE